MAAFEASMGMAICIICPGLFWAFFAMCFRLTLTPKTTRRPDSLMTFVTLPVFPLSLPEIIFTLSPFFILIFAILYYLRRQRNNFYVSALLYFPWYRTKNSPSPWFSLVFFNYNDSILVKTDIGAVPSPHWALAPHHDSMEDVFFLHHFSWFRFFYRDNHDIAYTGVAAAGTSKHFNDMHEFCSRVIGNRELCSWLYHIFAITLNDLCLDIGRHSSITIF